MKACYRHILLVPWLLVLAGCGGRAEPEQSTMPGPHYDGGSETSEDASKDAGSEAVADANLPDVSPDAPTDSTYVDSGLDATLECEAQEASSDLGPCDGALGYAWNGKHCLALKKGCACVGSDCANTYNSIGDCVQAHRQCYESACVPQPVADDTCNDCDGLSSYGFAWNGRECHEVLGCGCVGSGCDSLYLSLDECTAATYYCPAKLCVNTAGQWFPEEAGFCEVACGRPTEAECKKPNPVCICPLRETYSANTGCLPDPSCTGLDLCKATGGTWHPASEGHCRFWCGVEIDCDQGGIETCNCGLSRTFSPSDGCVVNPDCGNADPRSLCIATGGFWDDCTSSTPCSCGDYSCGLPNTEDPCVMPGCDCGSLRNFDSTRGCVFDQTCTLRGAGQDCAGGCAPGLVCCAMCGAYPCATCSAPCCNGVGGCMDNGCPPPPP